MTLLLAATGESVAEVFRNHCIQCHRVGGMAPFSVEDFELARPWAKSIARAVVAKEMPPFGADGQIGKYIDDPRLTPEQIDAIVSWARSPRKYEPIEYEPDEAPYTVRVEFVDHEIPGDGSERWLYVPMTGEFERDISVSGFRWVIEDDGPYIHHASLFSAPAGTLEDVKAGNQTRRGDLHPEARYLPRSGYFPGNTASGAPDGYKITIPKGWMVVAGVHLGPTDETTNTARMAIDMTESDGEELPEPFDINLKGLIKDLHPGVNVKTRTKVAPHDMLIHSVFVHMHELGRRALVKVNGEELIAVPRFDFDWQLDYSFAEPVLIEVGSEIETTLVWDNTSARTVGYGEGTEDEMGFVELLYTPVPSEDAGSGD